MLSALIRLVTRRPRRLTEYAVIDHFVSWGWDLRRVDRTEADAAFVVTRPDKVMTRLMVCHAGAQVDHFLHTRGQKRNDTSFAIVTDVPLRAEHYRAAAENGLVLVAWADIASFDEKLTATLAQARTDLRIAKMRVSAASPPTVPADITALTSAQAAAGFFCRTERISCWFVDRGGPTLLVTFAPWGSDPDRPTKWGEAFGRAADISTLGFETSEPNWFPAQDMQQCLAAAEQRIAGCFPERWLLGASQGGYAALKFSKALGATTVVAVSPQFSIDPAVATDRRFHRRYRSDLNSGMHIARDDVAGQVAIVFDSHDESDRAQVAQIAGVIACCSTPAPFSGHGCPHLLRSPDLVVQLLRLASLGDTPALRKAILGARHRNRQRAYLMSLALCDRHPRIALAIFAAHRAADPQAPWQNLCYRLAKAGYARDVLGWITTEAERNGKNAELQACAALVALDAGDLATASAFVHRALELSPRDKKYRHIENAVRTALDARAP